MIGLAEAIIGDMVSLAAVAAILAGIIKLFQVAASLNDIKDVLIEIRRNTQDLSPQGQSRPVKSPAQLYPGELSIPALVSQSGDEALQAALSMNPEP